MTTKITVAAVQLGPYRGSPAAQLDHEATLLEKAARAGAKIVCFSELMNVPYFCCTHDDAHFVLAERLDGPTVRRLADLSRNCGVYVIATLFEKSRNRYFNSAVFISPLKGVEGVYRKVHLPRVDTSFAFVDEAYYFTPGREFKVFDLDGVPVGILICFDRSFPEAMRALWVKGAKIVFIPVASSGFRGETFTQELRVRALENSLFVVVANKGGDEAVEHEPFPRHHFGKSCLIDPSGQVVKELRDEADAILMGEIDLEEIGKARAIMDWREFRRPQLYSSLTRRGTPKG